MTVVDVRDASADDAAACAAIYGHYVLHTAVSFELVPPDARRMAERIAAARERHAWLVAVVDDRVVGYAYATPFADRPAYRWSCEVSLYVDPTRLAEGIGRLLYAALLERLADRGMRVAIAKIVQPNPASDAVHARFGFEPVGVLHRVGFKHGVWHDVAIHELELAPATSAPDEPH